MQSVRSDTGFVLSIRCENHIYLEIAFKAGLRKTTVI